MLNIGPQELILILVIALIVVGPTKLPELGRSIGKGLREIRKAQDEVKRTIQVNLDEPAGTPKGGPTTKASPTPARERATPADLAATDAPTDTALAGATVADPTPPTTSPDPTPLAAEPPPPSEISEISRTLGRSLAELRRAREEVQRSFRVDLGAPASTPRPPSSAPEPQPETSVDPAPPSD